MAGKKRAAPGDAGGRRVSSRLQGRGSAKSNDVVPDIYREMLAEAGAADTSSHVASDLPERPLKRRRPGGGNRERSGRQKLEEKVQLPPADQDDIDDDDVEFEDVPLPPPTVQTVLRDSEDEAEDEEDGEVEIQVEDVDFGALEFNGPGPADPGSTELDLNLTVQQASMAPARRTIDRRKPATKEEKERRVYVHKVHLLCLLSHVSLRNRWCNDPEVQAALRPLLTAKMVKYLNPGSNLSQFGRTESLKNGLQEVAAMFKMKYTITERGLRRALWAEDESQLREYQLPDDIESTLEKSDFLEAAKTLKGSRDVGAQLFCALLRCAGVETRLVCSLQPLACVASAPMMPRQNKVETPAKPTPAERMRAAMAVYDQYTESPAAPATPSPRRRLGHPNAAAYHLPSTSYTPPSAGPSSSASSPSSSTQTKRIRGESAFPVYWAEVLDVAHQKWQPVDALVTRTQWRPRALEPPASDRANSLTYAVGFAADGAAKDVTRRYARAYSAKTRRARVDGLGRPPSETADNTLASSSSMLSSPGERWWRRTMRFFRRTTRRYGLSAAITADVDQIEDAELAAAEAREPMPRNVADFKDHPVYALERHLRRHEVLVPGARPAGTVGAGSKAPLERVYRRRDVRVARSREKWYRLGRVVRGGEEPVKILPKKKVRRGKWDDDDDDDDDEEQGHDDPDPDKVGLFGEELVADGTPIYMHEQTEPYVPAPVRAGRVPRNKFGNVEVYVPSMVPAGGAHVRHDRAAQAAHILGVDYAPALTGFRFSGRKGTAVLSGVVVPAECEEAVRAVIAGLEDLEAEAEAERRARAALRMWKRFLMGLRIRQQIWANVDPEEEGRDGDSGGQGNGGKGKGVAREEDGIDLGDAASDVTEEMDFVEDEDGGGGFLVEDDGDDEGGGGFMVE